MAFSKFVTVFFAVCIAVALAGTVANADTRTKPNYDDLLTLFADWREFESPPLLDGAPDYTAAGFAARRDDLPRLADTLAVF